MAVVVAVAVGGRAMSLPPTPWVAPPWTGQPPTRPAVPLRPFLLGGLAGLVLSALVWVVAIVVMWHWGIRGLLQVKQYDLGAMAGTVALVALVVQVVGYLVVFHLLVRRWLRARGWRSLRLGQVVGSTMLGLLAALGGGTAALVGSALVATSFLGDGDMPGSVAFGTVGLVLVTMWVAFPWGCWLAVRHRL